MHYDSAYINNLPEAEYMVIEESPLSDSALDRFLSDNKGTFFLLLTRIADKITGGKRGKIFTIAINGAGYSTSPAALNQAYERNAAAIDAYFNEIDMVKLARAFGGDVEKAMMTGTTEWLKERVPAFALGAAAGVAGLIIYKMKRKGKK